MNGADSCNYSPSRPFLRYCRVYSNYSRSDIALEKWRSDGHHNQRFVGDLLPCCCSSHRWVVQTNVGQIKVGFGYSTRLKYETQLLTDHKTPQNVVVVLARFFGGMVNSSLTTIFATMYPTLIRTLGLGWGNFFTNVALGVAANAFLLVCLSVV